MIHQFVSAKSDGADAQLVRPSNWNAQHKGELRNYVCNGDVEIWGSGAAVAPSAWTLVGASATTARNGTNFKHGLYSADLTRAGADASLTQRLDLQVNQGPVAWWKGRSVTFGCWVRATVADRARLVLADGVGTSFSSYHTGGSSFEWLTVTRTIDSSATEVTVKLQVDTANTTAQFDGATACIGVLPTDFVPSINEFGVWVTPAFVSGDYTAGGSQSWTVESGDVTVYSFMLVNKTMRVNFRVVTSTVGGTPHPELRIAIPGGYVAAKQAEGLIRVSDNGAAAVVGVAQVLASGTHIKLFRDLSEASNWSAATNNTSVAGQLEFEIQ